MRGGGQRPHLITRLNMEQGRNKKTTKKKTPAVEVKKDFTALFVVFVVVVVYHLTELFFSTYVQNCTYTEKERESARPTTT